MKKRGSEVYLDENYIDNLLKNENLKQNKRKRITDKECASLSAQSKIHCSKL